MVSLLGYGGVVRRGKKEYLEYMKTLLFMVGVIAFTGTGPLFALSETLAEIDRLHQDDHHDEVLQIIAETLPGRSGRDRGALLWREGRARMQIADFGHHDGDLSDAETITMLQETERMAQEATQLDPAAAEPWFWLGAAMGRRGQVQGVLNSLFMAGDVRDNAVEALNRREEFSEAFFLLGQVYRELPGRPLSFGNNDYAVSMARRAIVIHEAERAAGTAPNKSHDLYTQLGAALWKRNHNERQRRRAWDSAVRGWNNAGSPLERGFYFEGSLPYSTGPDRREARELVQQIERELSGIRNRSPRQQRDLENAQKLLRDWG